MTKYFKAAIVCLVSALCIAAPAGGVANANSAQRYWHGSAASGVTVTDENCPVTVESELLVFDITEFPEKYYSEDEEAAFNEYGVKVTAQYSFYNPADYDVDMNVVFPLGFLPDYYPRTVKDDTARYNITADGVPVERRLRHTFSPYPEFNADNEIALIIDGYKKDGFYSPELAVHKYVLTVKNLQNTDAYSVYAETYIVDDAERRIIADANGYGGDDYGQKLGWTVRAGDTVEIYSVGKELDVSGLDWWFSYYDGRGKKRVTGGEMVVDDKGAQTMTFAQFAERFKAENSAVSETDWYNAVVDCANFYESDKRFVRKDLLNLHLLRWYEYDLSIPAGGRLVNAVTAPMYPHIDGGYEPSVYSYKYLLSPAQSWAEFGKFEVRINTPFFLSGDGVLPFEKMDYGYRCHRDGLPDGELTFSLCEAEHPKYVGGGSGWIWVFIPVAIIVGIVLLTAVPAAVLLVYVIKKNKAKKNDKT